jgi:hypothetical protein
MKNWYHYRNYMLKKYKSSLKKQATKQHSLSTCSAAVDSAEATVAVGAVIQGKHHLQTKRPAVLFRPCGFVGHTVPRVFKRIYVVSQAASTAGSLQTKTSWGVNNDWYSHAILSEILSMQLDVVGHTVSPDPKKIDIINHKWCPSTLAEIHLLAKDSRSE